MTWKSVPEWKYCPLNGKVDFCPWKASKQQKWYRNTSWHINWYCTGGGRSDNFILWPILETSTIYFYVLIIMLKQWLPIRWLWLVMCGDVSKKKNYNNLTWAISNNMINLILASVQWLSNNKRWRKSLNALHWITLSL